jgi:hypothetical protein
LTLLMLQLMLGACNMRASSQGGGQLLILPTLAHDVAAVDVDTGAAAEGWPVTFEGSHFHAAAAVHDVNGDGVADVCAVSAEGHIFWLQASAAPAVTVVAGLMCMQQDWRRRMRFLSVLWVPWPCTHSTC